MAKRLLPFRQYDEKDVINLYAYEGAIPQDPSVHGDNDEGVFVKVSNGDMNADVINYVDSSYLGKTDYPHVGRNQYPTVPLKFGPADTNATVLGVTLRQTLTHDENGEKLNYNRQKADELYAVLTGQAVPVLTRGVITLDQSAVEGTPAVGDLLSIGSTAGKVKGLTYAATDTAEEIKDTIGRVLGTGSRTANVLPDQFAGAAGSSSAYYVVQFDCV